jgi:hypothetical protein
MHGFSFPNTVPVPAEPVKRTPRCHPYPCGTLGESGDPATRSQRSAMETFNGATILKSMTNKPLTSSSFKLQEKLDPSAQLQPLIDHRPSIMPVDLRLALLMCDEPAPHIKTVYGDYEQPEIFTRFLSSSLARTNLGAIQTFTLDAYDVLKDIKYPPDKVHYDGLLISGSRTSPSLFF